MIRRLIIAALGAVASAHMRAAFKVAGVAEAEARAKDKAREDRRRAAKRARRNRVRP